MNNQHIQYQLNEQGIATITLNRPDFHNAFDDAVIAELTNTFQQAGNDPAVRLVILASTGKSFCAGGDLNWMRRMAGYNFEENLRDSNLLAEMLRTLNYLPKPTIARVQGPAYGGGVGLVACCDIAVASPNATFCLSEVKVGLIPATIGPYVVHAIGQRASRRYFTTAEQISADQALSLGLISELVDDNLLDNTIANITKQLLRNSPNGIAEAKRLVLDIADKEINAELIADTSRRIAETRGSEEGKEGLSAFLEKRKPSWVK
ncbi:1,4-dihydroxy-2-naphthoyl-CoA synthase [Zhongshania aliphaticivorans]|uniref:1,4-dihydroxy-2-naphthoyl-CoA synthase n=1 Tax=Zhongshania aliphaticivorans TaxID=1470434 RepID=A0A5S9Q243_9GAMM|nr:enoyl-CoA hydratase/isomerase family protein [Zhongshania aliphaticivorans]CAA0111604.1 1,4-dihydroxy-2-naphthoyl-CoA synthase [Zhongshania aliphaticivorans]CAA0118717.1 1,4-dihydroxy-2-naphthoyl-CoA synthase [Zhongshania aliphaticivorans]